MELLGILEKLREKTQCLRRIDDFRSQDFLSIESAETGNARYGLDESLEYYLEARITVTFWANQAQYSRARANAERALVHRLYGEILGDIAEVRLQISNGNRESALLALSNMESKLFA